MSVERKKNPADVSVANCMRRMIETTDVNASSSRRRSEKQNGNTRDVGRARISHGLVFSRLELGRHGLKSAGVELQMVPF